MWLHKFIIFYMEKFIILAFLLASGTIFKGTESDSLNNLNDNTVFHEVTDTTNIEHWYMELRDGEIYCYRHKTWEHLEIKPLASSH